jgi:carbon monoxide dehydrogenase subunit G
MTDLDAPKSYKLTIEGKGTPGFVRGVASVTLTQEGESTDFRYSADVQVGGLVASVGQRMLQGMATTLLHQFFESFNREVRSSGST